MSCESSSSTSSVPSEKDCSEILDRVFFFLDNCGPCLAKYNLERTVKTLVARSCTEVAPEGLRQRVMLSIRQVQIQITEQ